MKGIKVKNELTRITIDIPASLHKKFKALAARKGKSMRKMVIDYINTQLKDQHPEECPYTHIPNKKTIEAIENIEKGKNLVKTKDLKDLFKKLGI